MIPARRRWAAGALLIVAGWLASPHAVPIYDGVGNPDEPYRYVAAPAGATKTAGATSASAQSPVRAGSSTNGMSVQTSEVGPQFSLFVPPKALGAAGDRVEVQVVPLAPADQPAPSTIDGNVYAVTLTSDTGPVTLTKDAALATLYLRATTQRQPGPVMQHRPQPTAPWKALDTSRGGLDVYVSSFVGAGEYALAFPPGKAASGGGLPLVLLGVPVLLVAVVVVVRLRAQTP